MTIIAIISDIHANIHALQAVMDDLKHIAPDKVIVNGDIVGRGPQASETLEMITAHNWPVIQGNHEEFWVACSRGNLPPDWEDSWWKPVRTQIESLEPSWFDWMDALPFEHIIHVPGMPVIQIVHGSPRRINEGLYPHVPESTLLETLGNTPYPVVVGAHTHYPMDRQAGCYRVLNCGSVGAPFNENPAAQYLLLIAKQGDWHAEFREVIYDHHGALSFWQASGYCATGVAAQIFAYELETATFHFWHYVRFCKVYDLAYNKPSSFGIYRRTFPAYREFCIERQLSPHDTESLRQYRATVD